MIWTAIGYSLMEGQYSVPFLSTFSGSHGGNTAMEEAKRMFKDVNIVAVVAGNHTTSTYIYEP